MTAIDCVGDEKLQEELMVFLRDNCCSVISENSLVVTDKKLAESEINLFLEKTCRSDHKTTFVDADSYVIAIPVEIKDIGLDSCEFCGYTGHTESIAVHRRTHQGL